MFQFLLISFIDIINPIISSSQIVRDIMPVQHLIQ